MQACRQAAHPAELFVLINHFVKDVLQAAGEGKGLSGTSRSSHGRR